MPETATGEATSEVVHLFVTYESEHEFTVVSPQLPGFAMGRRSSDEIEAETIAVILDAGLASEGDPVEGHRQDRGSTVDGREVLVRVSMLAPDEGERRTLAVKLISALSAPNAASLTDPFPTDPEGVTTFVACTAEDPVSWLLTQRDPRGDALVACYRVFETMITAIEINDDLNSVADHTLAEVVAASDAVVEVPVS